ncbi:MAG: glycosyltransferase family 9 protein [Fusobacteriaceae bacterium]
MEIKKIIISRTDKIGDLVLSIPSFFMLRKMFPDAEINILVREYNYEIVKNFSYIDRVIKIEDYTKKELLEKIEYFKADMFIALYNDKFISKLAKASKAKYRVGPYSKLFSFFTFNKGVFQKRSWSKKNEAEYNLDLVKKINPKLFHERYELNSEICLKDSNREIAKKFLEERGIKGKLLVVNPFMGGSAKNISDEQYANLLKKLLFRENNLSVIITVHISDEERALKLYEMIGSKKIHIFANGGELLNTAAIIERATVYFGGSTGPTHIAASLKRPIVAIYPWKKTQSPTRWGVFNWKNVSYLVVDKGNKKENYKHKYFDSYTEQSEKTLIKFIIEKLNEGKKI